MVKVKITDWSEKTSMNLSIRAQHVGLTEELQSHIERRLRFVLRRFEPRVQEIVVHLHDSNGTRGGLDKQCRLTAALTGAENVMVEAVSADLRAAVDHASERLKRAVTRELKRRSDVKSSAIGKPIFNHQEGEAE